jgi:DUF971 family protein
MNSYPIALKLLNEDQLQITWNDGAEHVLTVRQLRSHCPCATCRELRRGETAQTSLLPVLRVEETLPLRIRGMQPVGKYAYAIAFSDGHDTGIFTLEFLRQLGEELGR